MKVFANENLFELIIDYLREIGHDVISVREGLSGISDDEVYQMACKEKRVIITMDKDFSRIFRFPPEKWGGILMVRIYKRTIGETLKIVKKYYKTCMASNGLTILEISFSITWVYISVVLKKKAYLML